MDESEQGPGQLSALDELARTPSAASTSHLSRLPSHARNEPGRDSRNDAMRLSSSSLASAGSASAARPAPEDLSEAEATGVIDEAASATSAAGASLVVGGKDLHADASAVAEEDLSVVEEFSSRPNPAAATPKHQAPPQVKARLASVTDLQLILPERVLPPPDTPAAGLQAAGREAGGQQSGMEKDDIPASSAAVGPPPMVRPVLRGLIADVIEEMRVPEYEPAEVYGGKEVTPFLGPHGKLPTRARSDSRHEDLFGFPIGRPPPPYTEGPPPPYQAPKAQPKRQVANAGIKAQQAKDEAASQMREQAASLARVQEAMQAQTDALVQAQTQAQVQLQAITLAQSAMQAQREESLHLSRTVQQHADDARQRLEEAAARQAESLHRGAADIQQRLADVVRQEMQRDTAAAHQHLTSAVQQAVQVAQSALPAAPRDDIAAESRQVPPIIVQQQPGLEAQLFPAMVDGLRRIEVRLEQQAAQIAQAQSEERAAQQAAQLAALRSMQATPRAVRAIVPPSPPPQRPPVDISPAPAPVVATADVEAQVSMDLGQDHEDRVARFTEYLLHGPPGQREPPKVGLAPPLLAWPLPSDLVEIDAMLATALGVPAATEITTSESASGMLLTSSGLEEPSIGEVSYATWQEQMVSPGELSPMLPSLGEITSGDISPDLFEGVLEPGEDVRFPPGAPSASVSVGEVSGLSMSEEPSYGEVPGSDGAISPFDVRELEPGELPMGIAMASMAPPDAAAVGSGSPGSIAGATSPEFEMGALSEGEADGGADIEDGPAESS